jgi:hypothetical protein
VTLQTMYAIWLSPESESGTVIKLSYSDSLRSAKFTEARVSRKKSAPMVML